MWGADMISQRYVLIHLNACFGWVGYIQAEETQGPLLPVIAAQLRSIMWRGVWNVWLRISACKACFVCVWRGGSGIGVSACRWTGNNKHGGLQRNLGHLKCVCLIIMAPLMIYYYWPNLWCRVKVQRGTCCKWWCKAEEEWLLLYFRVGVTTPAENTMRSLRCRQPIATPADVKTLWPGLESEDERL